jgi:nucleoside-diphosphate-sugar epimerase
MSVVLLTGGRSFTARYLVPLLEEAGFRVARTGLPDKVSDDCIECDLTDSAAVGSLVDRVEPDYVVHLAGLSFVGHDDALDFYRNNTLATENLLEALNSSERMPKRVILAGSANIYGAAGQASTGEDVCPLPVNHYACSKLAAEHVARRYFDRFSVIVTRPFNYTGIGQSEAFVIPKLVRHFAERCPTVRLGNLDVARDFSDVRDVARIYSRLLICESDSTVVNICSGRAVGLREVIAVLSELSGHEIEVDRDQRFVRRDEIPHLSGDPSRLHELVGPMPRTTLRDTLAWMLADCACDQAAAT